jgi:hypothetical protein
MNGFGTRDVLAMRSAVHRPEDIPLGIAVSLPHAAAAVAVNEAAKNRCGQVVHLPASALVVTHGIGFDQKTVEVQYQGQLYFMFRQDLVTDEFLPKAADQMSRH